MRLTPETANALVDSFAARLSGGSIIVYAGPRPKDISVGLQRKLVEFDLPAPAFLSAAKGSALGSAVPLAIIEDSGEAVWAGFLTASGTLIADGSVGKDDRSDIVLTRTDLERNGTVELTSVRLRLPLGESS